MEIVIALMMYLGDPPELKEHLLMPSISECLKKKELQHDQMVVIDYFINAQK